MAVEAPGLNVVADLQASKGQESIIELKEWNLSLDPPDWR